MIKNFVKTIRALCRVHAVGFHYTYFNERTSHIIIKNEKKKKKKKSLFGRHKLWRHIFSLIQGHTDKKEKEI